MRALSLVAVFAVAACGSTLPPDGVPIDAAIGDDDAAASPDAPEVPVDAPPASKPWAKRFGGNASDVADAVAVLDDGGIILAGHSNGVIDFGGGPIGVGGETRFFVIARLTRDGDHVWSKGFAVGGNLGEPTPVTSIAVNPADDSIYVATGATRLEIDPGTGTLARLGPRDLVLLRFTSDGTVTHARRLGGTNASIFATGIALDGAGNIVAAGAFDTTATNEPTASIDLGTGALVGSGTSDAWAASFDATLASRWSRKLGEPIFPGGNAVGAVAVDPITGNVVTCGTFRSTVDFGGGPRVPVSAGRTDLFLVSLDRTSGAYAADTTTGGSSNENCADLAIDATGARHIAGTFSGTTSIGGLTATAPGFNSGFAAVLVGSTASSLTAFGAADESAAANSITSTGVVGGGFGGTIDIGGQTLVTTAFNSGVVARLDSTGAATHALKMVETGTGTVLAVADGPDGAVVVGSYEGQLDIDDVPVGSTGFRDIFVARLGF
jgi:hypothetical protein